MRHGKYQTKRTVSAFGWVLIGIALVSMTIGGVAAYLSMSGGTVKNTFTPETEVPPTIVETFEENVSLVKQNVRVNVGNPGYAVYVRAAVVVSWRDQDGNVMAQMPVENTDYTISMGDGWFLHNGYWYCKTMVHSPDGQADGITPALIDTCTAKAKKSGCHLHVEIIAQTIQALGTTDEAVDGEGNPIPTEPAVTNAWGVYVLADKTLSKTPPA